jgi:hypothetical protein
MTILIFFGQCNAIYKSSQENIIKAFRISLEIFSFNGAYWQAFIFLNAQNMSSEMLLSSSQSITTCNSFQTCHHRVQILVPSSFRQTMRFF